jgi:homoserine O-succinyltransferase
VEHLEFEVDYWRELQAIFDWGGSRIPPSMLLGGEQAVPPPASPSTLPEMFGVFPHLIQLPNEKLLRGFDDVFYAPHSRHTEIRASDIRQVPDVDILALSEEAGVYIVASHDRHQFYVTGHSEYDPFTLKANTTDVQRLPIAVPRNYSRRRPSRQPVVRWRGHANLLYTNWLNYYVYQTTPYDINRIPKNGTHSDF